MFDWIRVHIPAWVYITIIAHLVILGTVAYLILLERKTASWVQDRIGPNRVGFGFGLPFIPKFLHRANGFGQPLADGLKFIVKEDYRPANTDKILFTLAPGIMIVVIIVSIAVLPWGGTKRTTREVTVTNSTDVQTDVENEVPWGAELVGDPKPVSWDLNSATFEITYQYPFQIARLNIGVLYVLATLSLAVYGVVIGGWASNNKYSFLGGLRATANMISYEIPMGLAVLCLVLMFGTLDLGDIVEKQCHYWYALGFIPIPAWNVLTQPLAFVMFLVCIHAEANRAPFDLAEAEQELVGGYHTEYSSMRFALFFLAEYAGMITTSAVCVALFFGGWHIPWVDLIWKPVDSVHPSVTMSLLWCIVRSLVFFGKTIGIIFVFMWVRWSLPRFRFDQLMMLAWRALIPIALTLLLMTAIVVYLFNGESYLQDAQQFGVSGGMELCLLLANVVVGGVIMAVSTMLPPAPLTNRRVLVAGSRYNPAGSPAAVASMN